MQATYEVTTDELSADETPESDELNSDSGDVVRVQGYFDHHGQMVIE
jgi:hypothetical protein